MSETQDALKNIGSTELQAEGLCTTGISQDTVLGHPVSIKKRHLQWKYFDFVHQGIWTFHAKKLRKTVTANQKVGKGK